MNTIRHMNETIWFRQIDQYPKTVENMELLIYIVDKMGIFENFNMKCTEKMDANRLDLIYTILRITNREFEITVNKIVNKIFIPGLENIFEISDTYLDQIIQDMDNFVCIILKKYYHKLETKFVLKKLLEYFNEIFKNRFYKKMAHPIDNNFYTKNHHILHKISNEFVLTSKKKLDKLHHVMNLFLKKIFNPKTPYMVIAEINFTIQNNFDIRNLFEEECMEINIYCEQKMEEELEFITTESIEEEKTIKNIGYRINHSKNNDSTILQPFIDNRFASSKKELLKVLVYALMKFKNKWNSNYDYLAVPSPGSRLLSIDKIIRLLNHSTYISDQNLEFISHGLILKIFSYVFKTKIELYTQDLHMIEIDSPNSTRKTVIYQENGSKYYSLYPINHTFIPANDSKNTIANTILQSDEYNIFKKHQLKSQLVNV